jgi:hypothetical protein
MQVEARHRIEAMLEKINLARLGSSGHQRTTYQMLALSNEVGLGLCNSGISHFPRIVCRAIEELNMFVPN